MGVRHRLRKRGKLVADKRRVAAKRDGGAVGNGRRWRLIRFCLPKACFCPFSAVG